MITTVVSFLFVLGVLVIVHELGHFLVAKRLGIKVEIFSIGLGPKLFGFRKDDTDYRLSIFPIGGFVKMTEEPPKNKFYPSSPHFCERPPLDKIIVSLAGPLINIFLAFILLICIYLIGIKVPVFMDEPPTIGWIKPDSSAAYAGIQLGDRIVAVNKVPVATWGNLLEKITMYSGKPVELKLYRGQNTIIETIINVKSDSDIGFYPKEVVRIRSVVKNSPAETAGLQGGDNIKAVNQQSIFNWNQFLSMMAKEDTKTLILEVLRDGQMLFIEVHPETDKKIGKKYIGISYQPEEKIKSYSLFGAIKEGFLKTKETIVLTIQILWKLITMNLSINALGGPIMIAQVTGNAAQMGAISLLSFMAFLSIQLGIFNLLPFIPIVDGGQISFYLFEIVRKRPIGMVTIERISKVGWAAIICLILIVTYNDIMRIL